MQLVTSVNNMSQTWTQKLPKLLMYQPRLSSQHPPFSTSHLEAEEKTLCSREAQVP